MDKQLIVSSDSHIIEPEDLFEKALGQRYGDATPRYVEEHLGQRGKHYFTGYEYIRVDEIVEGDDATEESRRLQQELLEASLDPAARIRCLDKDGVWAEIVNSTWMLYSMRVKDDDLARDCCAVYNAFVAEYCSHEPKRLFATAMIHMEDVDWACRELERVVKLGHRSVLINCDTRPEWPYYRDPVYDPFWARAEEMDVPITLHIITGNVRDPFTLFGEERRNTARDGMNILYEAIPVLLNEFIMGGVMDRFPRLKLVLSEYEVSWLPYFMFRGRQMIDAFGPALHLPPVKGTIEEYMGRVYHGFIDDSWVEHAVAAVDHRTMMWGSDFPHARCTYPNSQRIVHDTLAKLGEGKMADLSYFNCANLYGIELPPTRALAAE